MKAILSTIALILQGSWLSFLFISLFIDFGTWILLSMMVIPILTIISGILLGIDYFRQERNKIMLYALILGLLHLGMWIAYMIYISIVGFSM